MNKPPKNWETNDYKRIRCNRIEGPSMIPATPTIGDLDGDGRLEVSYVMLWGSLGGENFAMPPKLLIKSVDTTTLYGHISSTMTMTKTTATQPEAKKRKEERPCHEELEG